MWFCCFSFWIYLYYYFLFLFLLFWGFTALLSYTWWVFHSSSLFMYSSNTTLSVPSWLKLSPCSMWCRRFLCLWVVFIGWIKKLTWLFDRQHLGRQRRQNWMLGRSTGRELPWSCQVRHAESFPVSHDLMVTYRLLEIGWLKMWELANKRLELMGHAVFKWIQFLCDYFRCKLAGWLGPKAGPLPPTTSMCLPWISSLLCK